MRLKSVKFRHFIFVLLIWSGGSIASLTAHGAASEGGAHKPNILMLLIDDLGYSDIGAYGGEIETSTIDELARQGAIFSNAHAYPTCAPSRASFMTGQDPHRVGLGGQGRLRPPGVATGAKGYEGELVGDFISIAKLLLDAGYHTYHSGKWHLGSNESQRPEALGFSRHFSLIDGAASHYRDMMAVSLGESVHGDGKATYYRNGEQISELPEDFYSTKNYTEEMIKMIASEHGDGKPFFGYLAYTAVHDPLQAPEEYIDKYRGDYRAGYRKLREKRTKEMARRGLLSNKNAATQWLQGTPDWNALTEAQREDLALRYAIYAAMLDYLDDQLAIIVSYLKSIGEYENTLIVIMSDNGSAPMPRKAYTLGEGEEGIAWQKKNYPLSDMSAYGKQGSFVTLGAPNAQAASGVYYTFKANIHEGGTRVPLIIKPPFASSRKVFEDFVHISDLYPTFAELAQIKLKNKGVLLGRSIVDLLKGNEKFTEGNERGFGSEFMGFRSYRLGQWKLVYVPSALGGTNDYALYNIDDDPGETSDLSRKYPALVNKLDRLWHQYAADNGVIIVPIKMVNERYKALSGLFLDIDWAE